MPHALRLSGLRKRFGRVQVLSGLDLEVPEGAVYGFLGRNGAGKSTTIHTILGLQRAEAGTVELLGEQVKRPSLALKRRVGMVGQQQDAYDWMRPRELGAFVGAFFPTWEEARFERLLARFDVPTDRTVRALSHGTRVKLALSCALAHQPELLILDEPTAGLDPAARREFLDLVREHGVEDGRTTFFSTHLVDEVERLGTHVGILDAGRARWEGTVDDLRASVRRLHLPEREPLPAALEVLEEHTADGARACIALADPAVWRALEATHPITPVTLEDAFLALAVGRSRT